MSQTSIMVYSQMGLLKLPLVVLLCSVFSLLSFIALCDTSELTVKFLETPHAFSNLSSTKFVFEVLEGGSGACTNCNITCKLDDGLGRINASQCENGTVLCEGLQDGNHKFEVCPNGTKGVGCSSYYWTVDTVPPTANISASTPFTNALNVSINISFSEPCTGGGGFACSSVNACNLLVYDAGQVIPTSLKTLQPNLQYSVLVDLSSTAQSGRVILVMDKNFCTDSAGNKFERNKNSNFTLHFDRRSVNLTTHVPKRQLQLNGKTILVRATNNCEKLRVCLTFPEPVLNTSEEIKNSLKAEILYSLRRRQGSLLSLVDTKKYGGPSRFEFKVAPCIINTIVVNVSIDTNSIINRQGTSISPVEPFAFIYDSLKPAVTLSTLPFESLRPAVMLSTLPSESLRPVANTSSRNWTREGNIFVLIKFVKPVFGFSYSNISITGGKLQSFIEENNRRYIVVIKADQENVSVNVPANVTGDAAGNKNQPSNVLQVMHRSAPKISPVFYVSTTGSFVVIATAAGLLTVSIASLNSIGEFSSPFPSLSQSQSNLFRIACHLQVIALSGWLAVRLPAEYYELTRGLRWSIPYLSLPWERETGHTPLVMGNSSLPVNIHTLKSQKSDFIKPLLALVGMDHESPAETEHLDSALDTSGWKAFGRNMFWLAIIGGGLINVHALLLLILKLKKNSKEQRDDGVLKKNSEEQRDDGVLKKNFEEQSDGGVLKKNSEEQRDDGVLKKNSEERSDGGVLKTNSEEQSDDGVLIKNSEEQRDDGVLKKNSEEQRDGGVLKKNSEEQSDGGVLKKNSEEQSDAGVLKKNSEEQKDGGVLKKNSEEQRDSGVLKKNSEEQRDDGVLEKNSEEQSDGGVLKKNSEEQRDDGVLKKNSEEHGGVLKKNSEEQRDGGVLKKNSEEQNDGGALRKNSEEQSDDGVLIKNSEEQSDGGVLKKNSEEQSDGGVLNKNSEEKRDSGVLTSPRFEIIIVNLGLTSICQASAAIIIGEKALGIAVGVLLLGVVSFLLLAWLLFLYKGITRAHLLEYEEVHQEVQGSPCCQKIFRAFLVLVKEHKWKSTDQQKSNCLPILGSLYEEFRGPPTQNSGGSSRAQAEAPLSVIQKLCGQLRIYYPFLESVRRVLLATMAGFYKNNPSSKIPPTFSLCINCFHLFFLVLEKPFTKKNIQLLEITAVSSEACISAIIFVLAMKESSEEDEKKFGISMLILVLVGILPQIMNELYNLYKQIKQLDSENNFLLPGLKRALTGLTSLCR